MDSLLQEVLRRASAEGGEEWLRSCLSSSLASVSGSFSNPLLPTLANQLDASSYPLPCELLPEPSVTWPSPGPFSTAAGTASGSAAQCDDTHPAPALPRGRVPTSSRARSSGSSSAIPPDHRVSPGALEPEPEVCPRSRPEVSHRFDLEGHRPPNPEVMSSAVCRVEEDGRPSKRVRRPRRPYSPSEASCSAPVSSAAGSQAQAAAASHSGSAGATSAHPSGGSRLQSALPSTADPGESCSLGWEGELSNFVRLLGQIVSSNVFSSAPLSTTPPLPPPLPSPSQVWVSSVPSDVPAISNPPSASLPLFRQGVGESCYKEALTCDLSPLGYHLPSAVKEKIWRGDYVDILSLLPSTKEFVSKEKKDAEEERRRPVARNFNNWLQAFCILSSVLGEKRPELCSGLFQHLDNVLEAYKHFGNLSWFFYDESYRQKLAVHSHLKWGSKDVGLWLNLMLPHRSQLVRPSVPGPSAVPLRKGVCFAFNESQCKFPHTCRFRHECSVCGGLHPAFRCFKRSNPAAPLASKELFLKGTDPSEPAKHVAVARTVSRSQDQGAAH